MKGLFFPEGPEQQLSCRYLLKEPNVAGLSLVYSSEVRKWHEVLEQVESYDFYHLPRYHLLSERNGEGQGFMFVFCEGTKIAGWPFMIKPIQTIPGLEKAGQGLLEATSVYGYPGPVCNAEALGDSAFVTRFGIAVEEGARQMGLITLFSRLNPAIDNASLALGAGTLVLSGQTVSIDLSESPEIQFAKYRSGHRHDVRKVQEDGVFVYDDREWSFLDEFIELYTATMDRVGATDDYYFDRRYFLGLRQALGSRMHLFVAVKDGRLCSGGLFVKTGGIVQYHLSANAPKLTRLPASKVIVDAARRWGNEVGARWLHLGGGVGAKEDGLFQYKAGFSAVRHNFFVWKDVIYPEIYSHLVNVRRAYLSEYGLSISDIPFFPAYRAKSMIAVPSD